MAKYSQLFSVLSRASVFVSVRVRGTNFGVILPHVCAIDYKRKELWNLDKNIRMKLVQIKYIRHELTTESGSGSPPASISKTLLLGFSLKRVAITLPAAPAPTTIKSNDKAVERK
jgi:hypothetical protein